MEFIWHSHKTTRFFWILIFLWSINNYECRRIQNITRFQRDTRCGIDQFKCSNGFCILEELQCDGVEDCPDGSDETRECKNIPCNSFYGFRCDYGGCTRKDAKCNGITECKDNSDEIGCNKIYSTDSTRKNCGSSKFTCKSGECIDDAKLCDGHADCQDNSDETTDCSMFSCNNSFRCKYGGCAVKTARCNGIQECFDSSDEEGCILSISKQPEDGGCIVPKVPSHGVFINSDKKSSATFRQGDVAPNLHALITKCDKHYKTVSKGFPICIDGEWTAPPLECLRSCTAINSTKSTNVSCKLNDLLDSCSNPLDGTVATIKCKHGYQNLNKFTHLYCRDGSWDYPIGQCEPVCGHISDNQNRIGIQNSPWHVGIYANDEKKTLLCAGSIISERIIISAAHCVTDSFDGKQLPKEGYLIAAGKYHSVYNDKRDSSVQYASIMEIHIPARFKGVSGHFEGDIAVIILNRDLIFSTSIQPICVDWNNEFELEQLTQSNMGVVVGWSIKANQNTTLKELKIPFIPYDTCYENVPQSFRAYLVYDKICGGILKSGDSVCQGLSGAGLMFRQKNTGLYYLRGVLSSAPIDDDGESCDVAKIGLYTLISRHSSFIKSVELENQK